MTEQRVALVTGANRGLGLAIAGKLAATGMHVVLAARDERGAQTAANDISAAGLSCSAHQLDVTDPGSVVRAITDTAYNHGRLDVLVNNAAIAIDRYHKAETPDMEKVQATLDANLLGTWRCCAAAIPEMKNNGYGRIVNLSTHMASLATMTSGSAAYRVSKTAIKPTTHPRQQPTPPSGSPPSPMTDQPANSSTNTNHFHGDNGSPWHRSSAR
jgi:NAD(P)-dependent dehydrogenase (short-subunit alcohol dehydrogenase family)